MSLQKIMGADGKVYLVSVVDNDRQFPLTPWHDPEKHPPTRGVSSAYVPQPYPLAVYTSYNKYVEVNSDDEKEAALGAGGSLNYADFPEPVEVPQEDQMAAMKKQIAMLEAMLIKSSKKEK